MIHSRLRSRQSSSSAGAGPHLALATSLLLSTIPFVNAQQPPSQTTPPSPHASAGKLFGAGPQSSAASTTTSNASSTSPSNPTTTHRHPGRLGDGHVNFYYIGVIFFAIFLGVVVWLFHIRRRRLKLRQAQYDGQDALARDIDGMPYPNNRRWAAAARRGEYGYFGAADEGLDERGEAPPPYKSASPAGGTTVMVGPGVAGAPAYEGASADAGVAIPLQTFQREGPAKPPEYLQGPREDGEGLARLHEEQNSSQPTTSGSSLQARDAERLSR